MSKCVALMVDMLVMTTTNICYNMHNDLQTSKNYLYCCTVRFEDSLNITHQQMH